MFLGLLLKFGSRIFAVSLDCSEIGVVFFGGGGKLSWPSVVVSDLRGRKNRKENIVFGHSLRELCLSLRA